MSSPAHALEPTHASGFTSVLARAASRFFTLYFGLYALPFPFVTLGLGGRAFEQLRVHSSAWLASHVFGLEHVTVASAAGTSTDRAVDYVWLAVLATSAALGTLGWSLAKPSAHLERRLIEIIRVYVRYVLAIELIGYGLFKVLPVQFGTLDPIMLTRTIGELPPMRLLWAFMAASTPYTFFAGAAEVLGACLLFARRTALLGSLILAFVMTNVVLLNLCYDVPIKIKSSHLLGSALFLVAPEASRLWQAVMPSRPAPSPLRVRSRAARWLPVAIAIGGIAAAVAIYASMVYPAYASQRRATRHPLYGAWQVESPRRQTQQWQRVAIANGELHVIFADARRRKLRFEEDAQSGALLLVDARTKAPVGTLHATLGQNGLHLRLGGELDQQRIALELSRKDDFVLLTRGFHWVNDASIKDY